MWHGARDDASKAIVVLGLEQVRTLALATLLLSKLKNKRQASTLEGEFATAIYASTLAREIARARNLCHPNRRRCAPCFDLLADWSLACTAMNPMSGCWPYRCKSG